MSTETVVLWVLGLLQIPVFGILGWALSTLIAQGTKITTLEANASSSKVELDRRFDDINEKLDTNKVEMNAKLDDLKRMLGDVLGHHRIGES